MDHTKLGDDTSSLAQDILGYLNFASGAPDPRFLKNLCDLGDLCVLCVEKRNCVDETGSPSACRRNSSQQ